MSMQPCMQRLTPPAPYAPTARQAPDADAPGGGVQLSPGEQEAERLMQAAAAAWNGRNDFTAAESLQRKALKAVAGGKGRPEVVASVRGRGGRDGGSRLGGAGFGAAARPFAAGAARLGLRPPNSNP